MCHKKSLRNSVAPNESPITPRQHKPTPLLQVKTGRRPKLSIVVATISLLLILHVNAEGDFSESVKGDLMLGGVFPLHQKVSSELCSEKVDQKGFDRR